MKQAAKLLTIVSLAIFSVTVATSPAAAVSQVDDAADLTTSVAEAEGPSQSVSTDCLQVGAGCYDKGAPYDLEFEMSQSVSTDCLQVGAGCYDKGAPYA